MNTNAATVGRRISGSGVLADLPELATFTFHPSQDGASGGWFINAPSLTGDNDDGYQPV